MQTVTHVYPCILACALANAQTENEAHTNKTCTCPCAHTHTHTHTHTHSLSCNSHAQAHRHAQKNCIPNTCKHKHVSTQDTHTLTDMHACMCTSINIHKHARMHTCVHMQIGTLAQWHESMHACTNSHAHAHAHTHTHTHTHMHVHARMHVT
jgi:hypothetical protein